MTCKTSYNDQGELTSIVCSSSWGIGVYNFTWEDGTEESIYGFPHSSCDPHDFTPDYESCTEKEITAWKESLGNCKCGR